MKKINVLLIIVFSAIFLSCGKKEGNNDVTETEAAKEVVKDCGCNELELTETDEDGNVSDKFKSITKKGSKELFTGSCVEKDQNDSIIRKIDVKNGWLIKQVLKEKTGNTYITTMDMNYENQLFFNGWYLEIEDVLSGSNEKYVSEFNEYKNGKSFNSWGAVIEHKINIISVTGDYKNGEYFDIKAFQPKCMQDSEFEAPYSFSKDNGQWRLIDISPQKQSEVINCLKGELPHFDYWKI